MRKILKVAQREYVATAKTKAFIIGVLMAPVIIGAIIFFTSRTALDKGAARPAMNVAVTDLSNELSEQIKASFDEYNRDNPERKILIEQVKAGENAEAVSNQQKDKVRRGQLNAYVVLDEDIIEGAGKIHVYTRSTKASEFDVLGTIEYRLNRAVVDRRCQLKDVSPKLLAELRRWVPSEQVKLGVGSDEERVQKKGERIVGMMAPFFFMYLMFFGIFVNGQQMLTSLIEEKSSRVIEVLLSAISPFELMAGKIVGLVGIGLTVISIWSVGAYLAVVWRGWNIDFTAELMVYFVIFYILGFFLFSSILACIGSICNTLKEAQSLMTPVTLVFILPLLSWFNLVRHPNGTLARVLSFVPPVSPMVVVLRLSASSDIWVIEILASIILLVVTVPVVMWVAAKIFRTGILMYGKRPGFVEVLRWLRQS